MKPTRRELKKFKSSTFSRESLKQGMPMRFIAAIFLLFMTTSSPSRGEIGLFKTPNLCKNLFKDLPQPLSKATKTRVLDRILGQITIEKNRWNESSGVFDFTMDKATRKSALDGEKLISTLESHVDPHSPTSVRLEEKVVVSEKSFQDFLKETQSQEFSRGLGEENSLKWSLRDSPPPGAAFITLTEYGKSLTFFMDSSHSTFQVKPRFRKYFEFPLEKANDLSSYKSVMGSLTAFELKMNSVDGPADGKFLSVPASVFKPRILVTDVIADGLKRLNGRDENIFDQVEKLRQSALALGKNDPQQVDAMFHAVLLLLAKDPDFFKPTYIVKYQRSSYKYVHDGKEFQFTADRDVKIYRTRAQVSSQEMTRYLAETPLAQTQDGEIFVELKSPISEKIENQPLYTALIRTMEKEPLSGYKAGRGKFALAKVAEEKSLSESIERTLLDHGTQFWLIKGLAYLDYGPRKRDASEQGEIELAYPLPGEEHRVYLKYRPLNTLNGERQAILEKIKVLDRFGEEIKMKPGFSTLVDHIRQNKENEIVALTINGVVFPFKSKISSEELITYQNFMSSFFSHPTGWFGSPRNFTQFVDLKSNSQLTFKQREISAQNAVSFLVERAKRIAIGVLITGAAVGMQNHYYAEKMKLREPEEISAAPIPSSQMIRIDGLVSSTGRKETLITQDSVIDQNYNYFLDRHPTSAEFSRGEIYLFDQKGLRYEFTIPQATGQEFSPNQPLPLKLKGQG